MTRPVVGNRRYISNIKLDRPITLGTLSWPFPSPISTEYSLYKQSLHTVQTLFTLGLELAIATTTLVHLAPVSVSGYLLLDRVICSCL